MKAAELIDEQDERADRDEHRRRIKTEGKNLSWVMMVSELGEWGELYTGWSTSIGERRAFSFDRACVERLDPLGAVKVNQVLKVLDEIEERMTNTSFTDLLSS